MTSVQLRRGDTTVLADIDWRVEPGERWVLLGPNGSGKTSLVAVASMWLNPSSGSVEVADGRVGTVDVRTHRARVPIVSAWLADQLRPTITVLDVVLTAKYAALEAWWHSYDDADRTAALQALDRFGAAAHAARMFGTLSTGERQRVLLARAMAFGAAIVFLDEPMAGLDLGGREDLIDLLAGLASDGRTPPIVLVTHHVDEIPPGFTHGLLLRSGRVLTSGRLDDVLTSDALSTLYERPLEVERRGARWISMGPSEQAVPTSSKR